MPRTGVLPPVNDRAERGQTQGVRRSPPLAASPPRGGGGGGGVPVAPTPGQYRTLHRRNKRAGPVFSPGPGRAVLPARGYLPVETL